MSERERERGESDGQRALCLKEKREGERGRVLGSGAHRGPTLSYHILLVCRALVAEPMKVL